MLHREGVSGKCRRLALVGITSLLFVACFVFMTYHAQADSQIAIKQEKNYSSQTTPWSKLPSDFTGKTIHYTFIQSSYYHQGPASEKKLNLLGDAWSTFDSTGKLQVHHVVYTNLDTHSFFQETYTDQTTSLIVYGKNASNRPVNVNNPASSSCVEILSGRTVADLNSDEVIPFANTNTLRQKGYAVEQLLNRMSQSVPESTVSIVSKPVKQYTAGSSIQVLTKTDTSEEKNTKAVARIEVDQFNRVLVYNTTLLDNDGKIIASTQFAYGGVKLYNSQDIPASILSTPKKIQQGGCTR
ncbi:hypothetical protein EI42_02409 [Thermosporothrix hazakensis]|jgi:hypothetical protein|uniref:Uncharacterized protein n=1 Tax=Thermosporothrix hazakensis TaxID=644383 RepID=A0A326UC86_THEHA|nr:hypothetical protein [Thermosporothrix hazakensis]PZW31312.1 hypothetical protein EI42_02409 [Thermosporothrix hazakensis]GCE50777.1 hypothetical protein KTH_56460 [Thermosporothrix hazakensis]